ncbi:MAG: hypothetical protein HYU62_03785 [Caulobacterales bacterium]|nr:hypothetical protein [Caulobacterales bacterium]
MSTAQRSATVRPFLTGFAVPRTGGDAFIGHYSSTRHVWMVDGAEGPRPAIEVRSGDGQTGTSTAVAAETDDTDVDHGSRLGTQTYVQAEDDDVDRAAAMLLSVTTKTNAQVERDDNLVALDGFDGPSPFGVSIGSMPIH